jgi:ArpU family phage transcriptional regulator
LLLVWCPFFILKGGNGVTFLLPEINRDLTKREVDSAFERYRLLRFAMDYERVPKITADYSFSPSGPNNQFHSSTEDAAVANVMYRKEQSDYIKKMTLAVNRLSYIERAILIKRYMEEDDVYDFEVYNELGLSERKYYRLKARAFYKLAFALKIEVYEQEVLSS